MQAAMCSQLAREMPAGHALTGQAVQAIGRREDNDDVLFLLDGGPRCAVVHLTWRKGREESPVWPATAVFPDADAFVRECLEVDARERAAAETGDG